MLLPGAVPAPRAVLRDLIGLQVVSRVGQPGWAHLVGVDGRVHHHPGPAAQLRPGGQVHEHGPPVSPQRIDDQAARLRARTRRPIRGGRAGSSRLPLEVRIRDSQIRCPNESKKGERGTWRTPSKRSLCPPEKPRQLANTNSGSPSASNSCIAAAVLAALSGNHTCPACARDPPPRVMSISLTDTRLDHTDGAEHPCGQRGL